MRKRLVTVVALLACACLLLTGTASASAPNWDVTGTWQGNSGTTGNMVFVFTMPLGQEASGAVVGTITYDTGQHGDIVGYVDGDDFYFTRTDPNGYSASCSPCTISPDGTYFHGYGKGVEWEAWGHATSLVSIDVKPGSYPNAINLGSKGVVPVAILSTASFDATSVVPLSIRLGTAGVAVRGKGTMLAHEEDVNADGLMDLVVQVYTEELGSGLPSGEVCLTGRTSGGLDIKGCDEIVIVPA